MKKPNTQNIGVLLLITGLLIGGYLYFTADGSSNFFTPSDQTVDCYVRMDKNSVNSANCYSYPDNVCRASSLTNWFESAEGFSDDDITVSVRNLQLTVDNKVYEQELVYLSVFGFDSTEHIEGCVPKTASSVTLKVLNDKGSVLDSLEADLQ